LLESLRSFVGSWVAKILLVLLVGSFALWGVSGSMLGGSNANSIAQVGETNVSVRQFLSSYNRNMADVQRRIGRRLTQEEGRLFGVETRTLGNVVAFAVLDEYARLQSLSLSDDTLAKMLAENPQFRDSSGKFNRETFRRAVYDAQMRESDYITLQNASAIRGQVMQSFATRGILPSVFSDAMRDYTHEERKFSYVTITKKDADSPADPDDQQLKAHFESNLKNYAAPEYRKLELLKVEPSDLADETAISDEDIAADYESRLDTYQTAEQRRVQQIVFKSKELADAARKSLDEDALFETVLTDNKVTLSDADLGFLTKDKLPKALQDAAFSLELNTPSAILQGPFGPTILRVTETTPSSTRPLDEVKDDIRKDLALRKAADSLIDIQETIEDARAGNTPLADIGNRIGITTRIVEAVDRSGRTPDAVTVEDLPSSSDLLDQAFQTESGSQASPLQVGTSGFVWYEVVSITAARDRTLDEVAERVKADWIAEEEARLVNEKAEALKKRLVGGGNLSEIALESGLLVQTTGFLKRNGQLEGFPQSATSVGFSGDAETVAITDGANPAEKLLIAVTEHKGIEAQLVEVPKEQIDQANQGAADDLLNQMIANLQNTYTVTQNPILINQALTQGY
jgi:peptidyl-prolyl cis-trans isomerase D